MKIKEFVERELFINKNGLVFDRELNEYRNEIGEIEYLEVSNKVLKEIFTGYTQNIQEQMEG